MHETANPADPFDPKHHVLKRLGLLDALEWVPVGPLYSAEGGPLGQEPFVLGGGFDNLRTTLSERFSPKAVRLVDDMEKLHNALGKMTMAREASSRPKLLRVLVGLWPVVSGWNRSVAEVLDRDLGDDEAAKFALAANLAYYGDDPARLWWLYYAVAQSGLIAAGGTFVKGGSARLALVLAKLIRDAGSDVLRGRRVTAVTPPRDHAPATLAYEGKADGKSESLSARAIPANCAPHALAGMLAETEAGRLMERYAGMPVSRSLFSIHFGIRASEAHILPKHYTTVLLPPWMTALSDYASVGTMLGQAPAGRLPPIGGVFLASAFAGGGGYSGTMGTGAMAGDAIERWLQRHGG